MLSYLAKPDSSLTKELHGLQFEMKERKGLNNSNNYWAGALV